VLKDPNGKDLHEPVDAVTVAERRRQLQRQARRKQRSTLRIVALAALAVLVVLAVTGIVVYNSSAFAITEVRVQGAQRLTAEHLTSLAAVSNETTLLRVDTAGIEQRLALDPWVMSATIRRDFPATLTLVITERPIEALVSILPSTATGTTAQWLVSSDGIWLSAANPSTEAGSVCANAWVPPSELLTLPQIKDVARTARPVEGDPISDEGILNTLTILTAFSPETRAMVQSVSAPDKIKTALTLRNHVQVSFGVAEDIPEKEAAMLALLKEFEGTITQINVRVANRATYKTT
jgi:cell division protein FtsQ